jgi:hypothetical protein
MALFLGITAEELFITTGLLLQVLGHLLITILLAEQLIQHLQHLQLIFKLQQLLQFMQATQQALEQAEAHTLLLLLW